MFFTRQCDRWRYKGSKSLASRRIGVINGYTYGLELDAALAEGTPAIETMPGENALDLNLGKLKLGRIDTVIEYREVMDWTTRHRVAAQPRLAGCAKRADPLYIAFCDRTPLADSYARWLSDGMQALRRDGRLQAILARYGLNDWQ